MHDVHEIEFGRGCRTRVWILGCGDCGVRTIPQERQSAFIVIDAFLKHGRKLSAAERERIRNVARVLREGLWRKVNHGINGDSPEAAE